MLSRKFWSGKNFGPRTNFLKKIGPGGPYFSEKNGPPMKKRSAHKSGTYAPWAIVL